MPTLTVGLLLPGARLTQDFSLATQMSLKSYFALTAFWVIRSLQDFACVTTAMLLWHVQNFVVICALKFVLNKTNSCCKFEFWVKNHKWNGSSYSGQELNHQVRLHFSWTSIGDVRIRNDVTHIYMDPYFLLQNIPQRDKSFWKILVLWFFSYLKTEIHGIGGCVSWLLLGSSFTQYVQCGAVIMR